MSKTTLIIGWIVVAVLSVVIILQRLTIIEYKAACKDYRAAIEIYEN